MVPTKNLSLNEQIANCLRAATEAENGRYEGNGGRIAEAFRKKAARLQAEVDRIVASWAMDEARGAA